VRELNYQEYLNSPEWKALRTKVLERDECCVLCASTEELEVHHRTYVRVGYEKMSDLTTVCMPCHRLYSAAVETRRPPMGKWRDDVSDGGPAPPEFIAELMIETREKLGWK
jgi:5-methylcytosine-specific restriction endonuclease McrA